MSHVGMLLLTYVALLCQTGLCDLLSFQGIGPDFLALVVVVATFSLKGSSAVIWAAVAGLLIDSLSSTQLGVSMLIATLLACLIQTCMSIEWRRSTIAQTLVGTFIVFALLTASSFAHALIDSRTANLASLVWSAALTAVYSALLGLMLSRVWKQTRRFIPGLSSKQNSRTNNRWGLLNG